MLNENEGNENNYELRTCPNSSCNFDYHAEGAHFCILCGTLLYHRCDNCLEVNPRYAKFCHRCGTSIEDVRNFPSARFEQEEVPEEEE